MLLHCVQVQVRGTFLPSPILKLPFTEEFLGRCKSPLETYQHMAWIMWAKAAQGSQPDFASHLKASGLCRESLTRDQGLIKTLPPAPSLHAAWPNKRRELKDYRDGFWSKVRLWTPWHSEWNGGVLFQDLLWCVAMHSHTQVNGPI